MRWTPGQARAIDKIHEAVEEAVAADMSPSDLIRAAAESWEQVLDDNKRHAVRQFTKALKP